MMRRDGGRWLTAGVLIAATLWLQSGCGQNPGAQSVGSSSSSGSNPSFRPIPAGTRIDVALASTISSETAQRGDTWRGTVAHEVVIPAGGSIAAGASVRGVVAGVAPAQRGSRASLALDLTSIQIDGAERRVSASAGTVTAGSTRKRNLGAIAGSMAAGALIGRAVGDGRNATAGAVVGGAAATGVVAASKGFQVVLTDGTVMSFTVSRSVATP